MSIRWKGSADPVFYESFTDKVTPGTGLRHARYISLAAARDNELAQEKTVTLELLPDENGNKRQSRRKHGAFTYSLLKTLEQSGANLSYAELMRRVEMEVREMVDRQIPVLSQTRFKDDNQLFLRNEFITPPQTFPVRHRKLFLGGEWYMKAGQLHGIVSPLPGKPTVMKVTDGEGGERLVKVTEVRGNESVLDPAAFTEADKENNLLSAAIEQMAFPRITVGLGHQLSGDLKAALMESWNARRDQYPYLDLTDDREAAVTFKVRSIDYGEEGQAYILTRAESDIPLFIRHFSAATFLADANKVGKWECTAQIANPRTEIPRNDLKVEVEILENEPITPGNFAALIQQQWNKKPIVDPEIIHARYINDRQPAIKVRLSNTNTTKGYWVGALYLDSHFGITRKFLDVQEVGPDTQPWVNLGFEAGGQRYEALTLFMDPTYHEYGVTEIKDYIIFFISKQQFNLDNFEQESIELNPTRSGGVFAGGVEKEDDWFTIKIPVHIQYPIGKVKLTGGQMKPISRTYNQGHRYNRPIQSAAMSITGPGNFEATVQATNLASARRRYEQLKSSKSGADHERELLPPGSLWANTEGSEGVFSRNLATSPDNHLSILELTEIRGEISEDAPLRITPGDPLLQDETIVPFGYDPDTGLYFPLGYTDAEGNVLIQQLPPESEVEIGADGYLPEDDGVSRSLGGSVRLFFHKMIWSKLSGRHDYNTLSLVKASGNGELDLVPFRGLDKGDDVEARQTIATALAANDQDVLLLVHGFIGDSGDMVEFFCQATKLHEQFGAVLAFDYENLSTPIEKAAEALKEMLDKVEFSGKRLVIIGSSMGGLLARSFVEDLDGGAELVKKGRAGRQPECRHGTHGPPQETHRPDYPGHQRPRIHPALPAGPLLRLERLRKAIVPEPRTVEPGFEILRQSQP